MTTNLSVCIDYDDPLVAELIHSSLSRFVGNVSLAPAFDASLQWSSYEAISFEKILADSRKLCNSYIFRKALIRKHFLAATVHNWLTKHPKSILATSVPNTYIFECDYADYLDEALNESYELREALEANETAEDERKYFILKPSMTDRGQGIRLFSTIDELRDIFEEFEAAEDSQSDEDENDNGIIASQVRHFVVQDYVSRPLILETINAGKKFHIRAYVIAFGAIRVWVWSEMLALFAAKTYAPPSIVPGQMDRHLTNTCLQDGSIKDNNVMRFWSLPLSDEVKQNVFSQICQISGEIFLAAAAGQQMHFQTLTNAFEIFGIDFIIDDRHQAYLLEINSYPDFKQTGQQLTDHVVGGLFDEVTKRIICPFFNITPKLLKPAAANSSTEWREGQLELVQDVKLRGNW